MKSSNETVTNEAPVSCKLKSLKIGESTIDLAIQDFGHTSFIVVTQFQKFGSIFHISPENPVPGESSATSYHVRVLIGESKPEMIAFCEILASRMLLPSDFMILSLALKDETFKNGSLIKQIIDFIVS